MWHGDGRVIAAGPERGIGVIGYGLLGRAVVHRLSVAGYAVSVLDVDAEKMAAAGEEGFAKIDLGAAGPVEALFLAVYSGAEAAEAVERIIGAWSRPESLPPIVCTTTLHPDEVPGLWATVQAAGGALIEFPISGTSRAVQAGDALGLIAGDWSVIDPLLSMLRAVTPNWRYLGEAGAAARTKLAVNLILELNRSALAEGLAFASSLGLDLSRFVDVVRASPANSSIVGAKARKMIEQDFVAEGRCSQSLKDVDLMLGIATANGLSLPLLKAQRQLLANSVAAGDGSFDSSIVISHLRGRSVQNDTATCNLGVLA